MKDSYQTRAKGQELVEFAITIPLLLLFVMAVLDLGRAAYTYTAMQNAARSGARYGIVHPKDSTGVRNAAIQIAMGLNLAPGDIAVTWNTTPLDPTDTETVQVLITYQFDAMTPFLNLFLGSNTITMSCRTIMQLEQ